MSYGFNVRAASKADAVSQIAVKLDEVVASQPIHDVDRAKAETLVGSFLELIEEPSDGQEISISLNGSIGTIDGAVTHANVGVGIAIVTQTS